MKIESISYAVPSREVGNEELTQELLDRNRKHLTGGELDLLERKIRQFFETSGTVTRYHRRDDERAYDFAVEAGRSAIEKAGVDPKDVDLIIYAGVGRGWLEPATANLFQSELGLRSATGFDVLDACASWIRSLSIAKSFLAQKMYNLVMVLNCEFNFREYADFEVRSPEDFQHQCSAFTIGEAATATLVSADENGDDDSHFSFRTWGDKHRLCKIALPNAANYAPRYLREKLKPFSFFTSPTELMSFTIKKLATHFRESSIAEKVFDIVFTHSVSVPSTSLVTKILNIDPSLVVQIYSRFGNTVSATLPLAMAVAEAEGKLKRGMQCLLLMGSAGVTTGVGRITY